MVFTISSGGVNLSYLTTPAKSQVNGVHYQWLRRDSELLNSA